ncbi:MAG: hypothetical protein BWK75_01720 [Candidatus Altiarchaeales archaeon A3]|nr:MAG: hypothetical protein BWK75_01720 [Candidatus Altiarchaeales archaeon A3]
MYEVKMYEDILNLFKETGNKISKSAGEIYGTDEASEIIGNGAGGDKTKKIDKIAEDIVISEISKNFDDFCLISEEIGIKFFGKASDMACNKFFFVDPIDGSNNATRGIPLFSTSLAFSTSQYINDIKVGYVKNIFGEEYCAVKGKGSYKTDVHKIQKKILMNSKDDIEFLGVEFAPCGKNLDEISKIMQLAKHYRTVGSIALGLCYVAGGALDAYIDLRPPRILDLTAAKLIIEEAGGICLGKENLKVDTKTKVNLIAGNKKAVEKINKILEI